MNWSNFGSRQNGPLLLLLLTVLVGCQGEPDSPPESYGGQQLPPISSPTAKSWSPAPSQDTPVIAQVNGVAITTTQLKIAIEADGGETPPEQLLNKLVELELLAQLALEKEYLRPEVVAPAMRAALAWEMLDRSFKQRPPELFFDDQTIENLYYSPGIRVKFDHDAIYGVLDAQFTCCHQHYEECDQDEFEQCMKEEEPHAIQVAQDLGSLASAELFEQRAEEWGHTYKRINLQRYQFYYDMSKPHSQQAGYNVFNENVSRAAGGLSLGETSKPVASRNAWHVLFLAKYVPAEHRTLSDPGVREEIITKALPNKRLAEYEASVTGLRKKHRVETHPELLKLFFQ